MQHKYYTYKIDHQTSKRVGEDRRLPQGKLGGGLWEIPTSKSSTSNMKPVTRVTLYSPTGI